MLFIDVTKIVAYGGIFVIALLVFSETGLLLGLAIPGGETLVFTSGLLVSTGVLSIPVYLLIPLLVFTAISGDVCGFFIGKKFGTKLYRKKDTWYYRKKYFDIAKDYLHRHSQTALVMGKFLPVIRPFTPVVSGMTSVPFSRFLSLSAIASALYITVFVLAGYLLGNRFPFIKDYIFWILPVSIIVAIAVMYMQARKYNRAQSRKN